MLWKISCTDLRVLPAIIVPSQTGNKSRRAAYLFLRGLSLKKCMAYKMIRIRLKRKGWPIFSTPRQMHRASFPPTKKIPLDTCAVEETISKLSCLVRSERFHFCWLPVLCILSKQRIVYCLICHRQPLYVYYINTLSLEVSFCLS